MIRYLQRIAGDCYECLWSHRNTTELGTHLMFTDEQRRASRDFESIRICIDRIEYRTVSDIIESKNIFDFKLMNTQNREFNQF